MARIKIEDLPAAENLTPEQEELIQGAGLRSFRPRLEGLEDRQLMAAGFGQALLPSLVAQPSTGALNAGHFRECNPAAFNPVANAEMNETFMAQAKGAVPQGVAGRTIDRIVADQLNVGVNGNLGDHWRIRGFEAISATSDGRDFVVLVKVNVTWAGRKEETQTLSIRLTPSSNPGYYTVTSLEQGRQGFQFSAHKLGEMQRAVTNVQFRP